jgi:hypothetical protein
MQVAKAGGGDMGATSCMTPQPNTGSGMAACHMVELERLCKAFHLQARPSNPKSAGQAPYC